MITLASADVGVIVATSAVVTAGIAVVAFVVLYLLRRRALFVQLLVVGVAGVLATVGSVIAISVEMYLSDHDLTVLLWVIGIAALLSILLAWVLARTVRRSVSRLAHDIARVGTQHVTPSTNDGAAELAGLSDELAAVSRRVLEARTELEELDSARRRFFAWISHDLRTPLAALRVIAESAESSPSTDVRELAADVATQTIGLTRLVDDLFEISQLSSGRLELRVQQLDLHDILSDVVSDMRVAAARRHIRIEARGVGGQALWADPRGLSRIITNLLANAVRHAPQNSIVLITVTELDERVVLGILDQGSGVAVTDLDRMFDVGWREDDARVSTTDPDIPQVSGAGLGLSIARGFARAHGGDVTAERTTDGFRMNVQLPRDARVGARPSGVVRPESCSTGRASSARPSSPSWQAHPRSCTSRTHSKDACR